MVVKTRYAEIKGTYEELQGLDDALLIPGHKTIDEKVDYLVERAEIIMGMFPDPIHLKLVLMPDIKAVAGQYYRINKKGFNKPSFYQLSTDTIYISVPDVTAKILVHEIGHYLIDAFFTERMPPHLHEVLARYCEANL